MATHTHRIPAEADLGLHSLTTPTGLAARVLPCGTLYAIEHDGILINQLFGSPRGEGVMRLIVRERVPDGSIRCVAELVGAGHTHFAAEPDRFSWQAITDDLTVTATLQLTSEPLGWTWHVQVAPARGGTFDVILIQDVGLASRGQILNNELYTSQYLDHTPLRHTACGWAVATRQALPQQGGRCPWLIQACAEPGAASYATDGLQSFGLGFRDGGDPACHTADLPGTRMQHEAGWIALQSKPRTITQGSTATFTFVAGYLPDHPAATGEADLHHVDSIAGSLRLPGTGEDTIDAADAPRSRRLPARACRSVAAVVAKPGNAVRGLLRRPGHILRTSATCHLDERVMCSTVWMNGVFASQVTLGNTSFHKMLSVARDPLHVIAMTGLRLMVHCNGQWRLLATPTDFDLGLDTARWGYVTDTHTITVTATASPDGPLVRIAVGIDGPPLALKFIAHLVGGNHEYEAPATLEIDDDARRARLRPDPASLFGQKYPHAAYTFSTPDPACVVTLAPEDHAASCLALTTDAVSSFTLHLRGDLHDARTLDAPLPPRTTSDDYWASLVPLTAGDGVEDPRWPQVMASLRWMTHNAMVHLTTPRGLEQNSGAAWGVRDVCQGPVEFLLAADRPDVVRDILLNVFAQQWAGRHEWPQWYMHPPYENIRDSHSHGDVIVWPLMALCDYLEHTADFSVLDEALPYFDDERFTPTEHRESIREHVDRLLLRVVSQFIPGTSLIRYGEGDWNDALQPADPKLRDTMVSSWTVALLYHALRRWRDAMAYRGDDRRRRGADDLLQRIATDFRHHLMPDGIVAGYALIEGGQVQRHLLHPRDTVTGIHHSLIPMTRSMLAHLFTPDEARRHLAIIREHLLAPDGARLMTRPPTYRGGLMTLFKRAESSSFFGREIGLQYVHAHLRYCEAMALLGEADALYDGLLAVNPMTVTDVVPNARPRQREAYFSSSDAAFADRYDADRDYAGVMRGDVPVEGGWRIYSSGPGLYLQLVVRHLLGIRRRFGKRVLDPVLPARLHGLSVTHRNGLQLTYPLSSPDAAAAPNPYRGGR
mgnify:CR=1 FL=1